jgi:hypothetical protein
MKKLLTRGSEKMKKRKPVGTESGDEKPSRDTAGGDTVLRLVERKPFGSSATGPPPGLGSQGVPPGSARKAKRRGRLDRTVLAMLGKGLEDCFEEVRKQEVPERFKLLLRQF